MIVVSASQYRGKQILLLPQKLCCMCLLLCFPEASAHLESGGNQQSYCPYRPSHFLHIVWGGIIAILSPRISFVVDSSGANLVTKCRGFGGTELKARDVCSVQDAVSPGRGFCQLREWEGEKTQEVQKPTTGCGVSEELKIKHFL